MKFIYMKKNIKLLMEIKLYFYYNLIILFIKNGI